VTHALQDLIIWDNFREGNKEALEIIYEDNYSPLYYYALKFTNDKDLIKDLIQELFVELIDSGKKLARTDNVRVYLLKALRNKLLFQIAKKVKQQSRLPDHAEFNLLDSIETQLIKKEIDEDIQIRITSAVKKLSPKQQEIIYLRFYNDMPYPEIASLFDTKVQTVRNLLTRAISQLKEELENKNVSRKMILFVLSLPV
jgi:RNA polymerase sigma factor (sigma-70 family)